MKSWLVGSAAVCLVAWVACDSPGSRLNAPPHGIPESTSDIQGTFVYMTDNALLADMSISDRHFLPHRALLSSLGEQRLARLVSLMDAYGGTLRFNSDLEDAELIQKRVAAVVQFLAEAGVDTTTDVINPDLRGGRGMNAAEVILIRTHEGTYDPKKSGVASGSSQDSVFGP